MAAYHQRRDGQPYIVQGWPIVDANGEADVRFSGYDVLPRAECLFSEAGFRHGQQIPKELFYMMFFEGDITNSAIDAWSEGQRTARIPNAFRHSIRRYARSAEFRDLCRNNPRLTQAHSYLDVFRLWNQTNISMEQRLMIIETTAKYWLARNLA